MSAASVLHVGTGTHAVRAAFTTRRGGASTGAHAALNLSPSTGDDAERVRGNRLSLAATLGFDPERAVVLQQVHGAQVIRVGPGGGAGDYGGAMAGVARADALVTGAPGIALFAMGADCPGVLIWAADGSCVAAVHAGWRGLVAGVLEAAVAEMDVGPSSLHAVVGPGVGPCCYPVDDGLRGTMAERFGADVVIGEAIDLAAAARAALVAAGVPAAHVTVVGACTSCDEARFYSYRRDGAATGRHAGIIWRVGEHA